MAKFDEHPTVRRLRERQSSQIVKPLQDKSETIYVIPGSAAEAGVNKL